MKPERNEHLDSIATQLAKAMNLPAGAGVLDRIIKAIDIEAHSIIRTFPQEDGWTLAYVTSQSDPNKTYTVQMNPRGDVCLCSCPDWEKAHRLDAGGSQRIASFHCKHIMAVKLRTNPRLLSTVKPKPSPRVRMLAPIRILPNGYLIEGG